MASLGLNGALPSPSAGKTSHPIDFQVMAGNKRDRQSTKKTLVPSASTITVAPQHNVTGSFGVGINRSIERDQPLEDDYARQYLDEVVSSGQVHHDFEAV